ncbi:12290_t:CDS:1 [Cetraspora pellucida]|uniref:12290_t:CDS:1 n=1 Tax=Cetraspora pellucida TaxID=1433469 RepID=A0A9N9FWV7_9GLOM|nr:12290_t:CDS:1 [Cetraspora pellucida]
MDLTHTLVFFIFLETHSEIYLLVKEFNQLKTSYQTSNNYELELKETLDTKEFFSENIEFRNIQRNNKKIQDNKGIQDNEEKQNTEEIQQSDNQILTLLQIEKF